MPQSATLAKRRWLPSGKSIRPRSMIRVVPPASSRAAARGVGGQAEGAPDVAAGAARDQPDREAGGERGARVVEAAVDDLVEGAVTADHDHPAHPQSGDLVAGDRGRVPGADGEVGVDVDARLPERGPDPGPAAHGLAAGAHRVDHDQGGGGDVTGPGRGLRTVSRYQAKLALGMRVPLG